MLESYFPVFQTLILFGERVFREVIKSKWLVLNMTSFPIKRGNWDTETEAYSRKMLRDTGRRWPPKSQGKAWNRSLLHSPQKESILLTPSFQTLASRTVRWQISAVEVTQFVAFYCGSTSKIIHWSLSDITLGCCFWQHFLGALGMENKCRMSPHPMRHSSKATFLTLPLIRRVNWIATYWASKAFCFMLTY